MNDSLPPPVPRAKRGVGCFGIGCAIFGVILVVVLGIAGFAGWKMYEGVIHYTATEQGNITDVEPNQGEYDAVLGKVAAYEEASDAGTVPTLQLSEREFAVYMTGAPDDAELRKRVAYSIKPGSAGESDLILDTSFPLDEFPLMKGRYFNARIVLDVVNNPDGVMLKPSSIMVGDKSLPAEVVEKLGSEEVTAKFRGDSPKLGALLESSASMKISGDTIEFTGKARVDETLTVEPESPQA